MVRDAPPAFHVMAKPTGAICNLNCAYCFFLEKERLYPGSDFRMRGEVLEEYLSQYIRAQQVPEVTVAWQGGEPTLMGLEFFRRSVEAAAENAPPAMRIAYTMQTNGTLLDDAWCEFLRDNHFLVGLSLDGPRELHDANRRDKSGRGTFERVERAARLMQRYGVDFNVLCTVNAANAGHPLEVYRYFRDALGVEWIQFIPIVERINPDGSTLLQEGDKVTDRSVDPAMWGDFLIAIFDEWVRRDVGRMFVNFFEAAAASWAGVGAAMCIFDETCGNALALEHNGDLYACDHFVEPAYLLGNIMETPMRELVASEAMQRFGDGKNDTLPRYCRECGVLFACRGECPKNRFILTPDGEPGLNYLCAGYKAWFEHIDPFMRTLTDLLRSGRYADEIMGILREREAAQREAFAAAGRNDPCPCGSGRKYKHCHGR
jgi:serine-type anaerobic sulfatase-maturating enzyme